jgi:hypothetical protein
MDRRSTNLYAKQRTQLTSMHDWVLDADSAEGIIAGLEDKGCIKALQLHSGRGVLFA